MIFRISTSVQLLLLTIAAVLCITFPVNSQTPQTPDQDQSLKSARFLVSVDGGLGYLLGSTKDVKNEMSEYGISGSDADDYYKRLKLGEEAGASIYYYFFSRIALGLDYNLFTTTSSTNGYLDSGDGWTNYYGPFKEKIYTSFVGFSAFQTQELSQKWNLYSKFSLGMALYRNESFMVVSPFLVTGKAPAVKGDLGFSYRFSNRIGINAGVSYMFSSLRKIKVDNGTNFSDIDLTGDTKENLSRLNLSTGLQFSF